MQEMNCHCAEDHLDGLRVGYSVQPRICDGEEGRHQPDIIQHCGNLRPGHVGDDDGDCLRRVEQAEGAQ